MGIGHTYGRYPRILLLYHVEDAKLNFSSFLDIILFVSDLQRMLNKSDQEVVPTSTKRMGSRFLSENDLVSPDLLYTYYENC